MSVLIPWVGVAVLLAAVLMLLFANFRRGDQSRYASLITAVQDVGELVAVTALCQTVGEWQEGAKGLRGIFVGDGKAILIVHIEAQYKFDLRQARVETRIGMHTVVLPPCKVAYNIKGFRWHSEQESRYLPYVPGLRDILPGRDMPIAEKNKRVEAAIQAAKDMLLTQDADLIVRAQKSAENTLAGLFSGLHMPGVGFEHAPLESVIREEPQGPSVSA